MPSVHEYFAEVTDRHLLVARIIYDWVRLPKAYRDYACDVNGEPNYHGYAQVVSDTTALLEQNWPGYRSEPSLLTGSNTLLGPLFIHASLDGNARSVCIPEHVVSHQGDITAQSLGGFDVRRYALMSQSNGPGIFAHELGHLLFDWPDLYGQTKQTTWDSNGLWCLMGLGSTVQNEMWAPHPSALLKYWNGWGTTRVLTEPIDESITLGNVAETGALLKIRPGHLPSERFFLLEVRVAGNNPNLLNMDYSLPESGLLVWQIDESGNQMTQSVRGEID